MKNVNSSNENSTYVFVRILYFSKRSIVMEDSKKRISIDFENILKMILLRHCYSWNHSPFLSDQKTYVTATVHKSLSQGLTGCSLLDGLVAIRLLSWYSSLIDSRRARDNGFESRHFTKCGRTGPWDSYHVRAGLVGGWFGSSLAEHTSHFRTESSTPTN